MAKRHCFISSNCQWLFVLLFLINIYFGRTISSPTITPVTRNISSKSEVGQLSTMSPKIRQTLCNEPTESTSTLVTKNISVEASTPPSRKAGCLRSNGASCNTYVGSWSYFYLRIGGWLMLGIVLVGIACLLITHFLGMKKARKDPRRKRTLSRLTWTDAKTKSMLANWI
ncbi:uncharacterized protein LOC116286763 [Actinia tenebrosa]|uniref:Uncharacterized protein LOC116286763 n=1 Tax=Actinia tenebrosa TaxID=6105 RepID=A0A6P8H0G3_ACTTE|nr:uncharacterized protein LOC116286763 [Actinia tenebrosa]